MIKNLILFVIFTGLSNTYVVWALLLNANMKIISLFFMFLSLAGIFLIWDSSILKTILFKPLLFFLIVVPVFVSLFHQDIDVRSLGLFVLYFLTYILSYLAYKKYGSKVLLSVISVALFIIICSGFVSMFFPQIFMPFADLYNSKSLIMSSKSGRAFGMYLQPNQQAMAIIILYIVFIIISKRIKWILFLYPIIFLGVIITGSRSNIIYLIILSIFILHFVYKYYREEFIKIRKYLIPFLFTVLISIIIYQEIAKKDKYYDLINRIEDIIFYSGEYNVTEDASLNQRIECQKRYLELIREAPFVGHGFGLEIQFMEDGIIDNTSHNVFLELLFQAGLFYFISYIYFLISFYAFRKQILLMESKEFNYLGFRCLFVFILFYSFFSPTLHLTRCLYVIIGIISFKFRRIE